MILHRKHAAHRMRCHAEWSFYIVERYERIREHLPKNGRLAPRLSLSVSLKVTGTDMDRSATYDFLLVIHRLIISYSFCHERRFRSKVAGFHSRDYFTVAAQKLE